MTEAVLSLPPGLGWSVIKSPRFGNRLQRAVNGRALTVLDQFYPIYTFTLTIDFLRDPNDTRGPSSAGYPQELRALMDFYNARRGRFQTFLYEDPTDNQVIGQLLDPGTGSKTAFQLYRTMVDFVDLVTAPKLVSAVYVNNVSLPPLGNWTVDADKGIVNFISAPANGAVVTADFTYYFRCRFADDNQDFENFMLGLWKIGQLKFESVLP